MLADRLVLAKREFERGHEAFISNATFGGPSLHFHHRALASAENTDPELFYEMIYALLASWGMHRMGKGGAKMVDFQSFRASLVSVSSLIDELRGKQPENLRDEDWKALREVFCSLRCMRTGTSIVANSKVLAHWLPSLVPPVDRHYTLRFLTGRTAVVNEPEKEWVLFEKLLREFFYPLLQHDPFRRRAVEWAENRVDYPWDTSILKCADNVLIGLALMPAGSQV